MQNYVKSTLKLRAYIKSTHSPPTQHKCFCVDISERVCNYYMDLLTWDFAIAIYDYRLTSCYMIIINIEQIKLIAEN